MSDQRIVLSYRREGEVSTGTFSVFDDEGEVLYTRPFEAWRFDTMLYELARMLQDPPTPSPKVLLLRTDRQGSIPYALDRSTINLLRADPVAAVQAFTYRGSPSSHIERIKQERRPLAAFLKVGFDALADAFGEEVFCLYREGEVECPGCGYWSPLFASTYIRCKKRCQVTLAVSSVTPHWIGVRVRDLLATTSLRAFYLPRRWNPQPWIMRNLLENRFLDFLQEKKEATCSNSIPPPPAPGPSESASLKDSDSNEATASTR